MGRGTKVEANGGRKSPLQPDRMGGRREHRVQTLKRDGDARSTDPQHTQSVGAFPFRRKGDPLAFFLAPPRARASHSAIRSTVSEACASNHFPL